MTGRKGERRALEAEVALLAANPVDSAERADVLAYMDALTPDSLDDERRD